MALPGQGNWVRVSRPHGDLLSEEGAALRTCCSLGVRRRYRCDVPGTEVVRCEHSGTAGEKALGAAAIHGSGSGREPLLFSPRLTKRRIARYWSRSTEKRFSNQGAANPSETPGFQRI